MNVLLNSEQKNVQKIGLAMINSLNVLQMNVVELREFVLKEYRINPAMELVKYDKNTSENYDKNNEYLALIKDKQPIEEYILAQIPDWTQEKQDILLEIIYNLDERGFFHGNFTSIAEKFHVPEREVENISDELKNLHPYGLSSSNLAEALIIQVKNTLPEGDVKNLTINLIQDHLEDILHGFFKKIAKKESISIEKVKKISHLVMKLNFSPLSFFHSEDALEIVPDVKFSKVNGEWKIEINESYFPEIRFSKIYKDVFSLSEQASTIEYMRNCAKKVKWLSNAIQKRNTTLYKIANAILSRQQQFFEFGQKWLKGLSLKEIASDINVNISTVSRAILGKYADTPFGIKKMDFFFDSNVNGYSSTFIKTEIKKILQRSVKPLSDQKIADLLKGLGINVARRTITKYRKEDNLPNSRLR